jgi:hypothetical protein
MLSPPSVHVCNAESVGFEVFYLATEHG